jgi:hypothetical protein
MQEQIFLNVQGGDVNASIGRALRVQALDERGGSMNKGLPVTISVQEIAMLDPAGTLDCDSDTLAALDGTLDGYKMADACKPELRGMTNATDAAGIVVFDRFDIVRGPPGRYLLRVSAAEVAGGGTSLNVESHSPPPATTDISVLVESQVARIRTDDPTPAQINVGDVIKSATGNTVSVFVGDQQMTPLAGRRVVVFGHYASDFFRTREVSLGSMGNFLTRENVDLGYKNAVFEGHISNPTDKNGIATFPNLKVKEGEGEGAGGSGGGAGGSGREGEGARGSGREREGAGGMEEKEGEEEEGRGRGGGFRCENVLNQVLPPTHTHTPHTHTHAHLPSSNHHHHCPLPTAHL